MPGKLSTMANLSPIKQLNNEDFPEFGNPIKDTLQT
jgi:hypothetical protein